MMLAKINNGQTREQVERTFIKMSKNKVAVIFGGQSSEHEVSCVSATTIISNINKDYYEVTLIGITKEGRWLKVDTIEDILSGEWRNSKRTAVISPDTEQRGILIIEGSQVTIEQIDVIFPALHGMYGEDGTIQGLFELAKIPYVGCGVLASSVSMDKLYTKIIVDTLGIRQAKYVSVLKDELVDMDNTIKKVELELEYPVFVKPSNAGSSVGISKAYHKEELAKALLLAVDHDRKILVEETIIGREIECSILGGREPKASGIGEILSAADFYDYDAKYNNTESETVLSPELPEGIEKVVQEYAVKIFKAVDGYGLSRVDFFLEQGTNEIVFSEINTLPGFTAISMFPMLWESKGVGKPQLVEKLLQSALKRYNA